VITLCVPACHSLHPITWDYLASDHLGSPSIQSPPPTRQYLAHPNRIGEIVIDKIAFRECRLQRTFRLDSPKLNSPSLFKRPKFHRSWIPELGCFIRPKTMTSHPFRIPWLWASEPRRVAVDRFSRARACVFCAQVFGPTATAVQRDLSLSTLSTVFQNKLCLLSPHQPYPPFFKTNSVFFLPIISPIPLSRTFRIPSRVSPFNQRNPHLKHSGRHLGTATTRVSYAA
jgi:hypothetical protein